MSEQIEENDTNGTAQAKNIASARPHKFIERVRNFFQNPRRSLLTALVFIGPMVGFFADLKELTFLDKFLDILNEIVQFLADLTQNVTLLIVTAIIAVLTLVFRLLLNEKLKNFDQKSVLVSVPIVVITVVLLSFSSQKTVEHETYIVQAENFKVPFEESYPDTKIIHPQELKKLFEVHTSKSATFILTADNPTKTLASLADPDTIVKQHIISIQEVLGTKPDPFGLIDISFADFERDLSKAVSDYYSAAKINNTKVYIYYEREYREIQVRLRDKVKNSLVSLPVEPIFFEDESSSIRPDANVVVVYIGSLKGYRAFRSFISNTSYQKLFVPSWIRQAISKSQKKENSKNIIVLPTKLNNLVQGSASDWIELLSDVSEARKSEIDLKALMRERYLLEITPKEVGFDHV
jgi:hypothetical protein